MTSDPSPPPSSDDGLRKKTLQGGAFMAGRQVVSLFLKLVGVVLITRYLGPERYGAYVAAYGVYQFVLTVSSVGLNISLLRHEGELGKAHYGTANAILLGVSIVIVGGLELGMPLLSRLIGVEGFAEVARWLFLALPVQLVAMAATVEIERRLEYKPLTAIEIGGQVLYYAVATPLVVSGIGPVGLALAYFVQQAAAFTLAHLYLGHAPILRWNGAIAASLCRYSLNFSIANWIWQIRTLVNPLIVGSQLGAYAVGIVGMTIGILEMLSILKTIAWRLTVAVITRFRDDRDRIRRTVTQGMELQVLANGALLLGFGWLGQWIIPIAFGERWLPTLEVYPFIALAYLTMSPFNMHTATMSVLGLNRDLAVYHVAHVVLFAGAAAVLVPLLGMRGYGFGELAALPAYVLLHRYLASAIGMPDYRMAALWWSAAALGLFWRELGPWTIAVPFVALAMPPSVRRLRDYAKLVLQARRSR